MATYTIDPSHSEIAFTARHMVFAKVRGQFKKWNATLVYDPSNPIKSSLAVEVDIASIDTADQKRDEHLRSADFFDAATSPKMTFKSKSIEPAGNGHYKLVGDLTIKEVSRQISLDVEQTGGGKDPWGNERLGFSASGSLNRSEWGLKWNQALETGGVLVSDKIDIHVEAQVVQGA